MNKFLKYGISIVLPFLLLLLGIGIILYPIIGAYWNEKHESAICLEYTRQAADKSENDQELVQEDLLAAQVYNEMLAQSVFSLENPFMQQAQLNNKDYNDILNVTSDGVMAYLEIPKLSINLPIYHGTDTEILEKGIGHLPETSLPIGGDSTHAVLSGHTGMKDARMFTDLNQMSEGDCFYIHIYENTLCYQVDQIKTVLPTNTEDLQITEGKDYVTLMTCTPYGVNSHRLLVRGIRVKQLEKQNKKATAEADIQPQTEQTPAPSTWMQEYWNSLKLGLKFAAGLLLMAGLWMVRKKR